MYAHGLGAKSEYFSRRQRRRFRACAILRYFKHLDTVTCYFDDANYGRSRYRLYIYTAVFVFLVYITFISFV